MQRPHTSTVIDRANAVPLTPALLKRVMRALHTLPAWQRTDLTACGRAMIEAIDAESVDIVERRYLAAMLVALHLRIGALERLCARPEYRAWVRKTVPADTPDLIHAALLDAAATEPLIERDEQSAFEPVRFFRTALRRCEAEGRA